MIKFIRNQLDIVKTARELEQLSNRELDDIGIARGDITRIARKRLKLD